MSFQDFQLHPSLLQALAEIGFETPTPIQAQAIPAVMAGRDVLGSAQTGTGKTAAFMLPVLHELLSRPGKGMQVLVLEPTRELAVQVEEQAQLFGKHTGLRSACVYGGVAMGPQEKALKEGYEIIAATPGRLLDHMRQGNVNAQGLRVLVLDEVDRMLDMGFLPDVRSILRQLPAERQTLFFSATVPGEIQHLCDSLLKDPVRVAIAPERKTAEGISQKIYPVSEHLKPVLLNRLLTDEGVTSALVFTRTKQGADKVCSVVERHISGAGQVERIHGDRSQKERQQALTAFKEGKVKFLVATDIAARGIDIDGISHVINYDLPDTPEDYVHRIGRTARAGATGHAYSLMSSRESLYLSAIEQHLNMKLEKCMLDDFKYDEELGAQHEVRQGHDGIKHFDEKRAARAGRDEFRGGRGDRPRAEGASRSQGTPSRSASGSSEFSPGTESRQEGVPVLRDSDEHATVIVRRKGAVEGLVTEAPREREGRGGRGGRDRGRGRDRDRGPRPERPAASGQAQAPAPREPRRDYVTQSSFSNSSSPMSATEVLRRAGSQKAAVESTALELRPRNDAKEAAPKPAAESGDAMFERLTGGGSRPPRESQATQVPRDSGAPPMRQAREPQSRPPQQGQGAANFEGDGPRKRRRRRGGRGRNQREGAPEGRHDSPRPAGAQRGAYEPRRDARPKSEPSKPGLLSKLKGLFGLGAKKPSDAGFGDKW
jgi:ATP-dependent RNA helicase RhlE